MNKEPKSPNRSSDTPRDKPMSERTEHANLERPGAQAHPRARWLEPSGPGGRLAYALSFQAPAAKRPLGAALRLGAPPHFAPNSTS